MSEKANQLSHRIFQVLIFFSGVAYPTGSELLSFYTHPGSGIDGNRFDVNTCHVTTTSFHPKLIGYVIGTVEVLWTSGMRNKP